MKLKKKQTAYIYSYFWTKFPSGPELRQGFFFFLPCLVCADLVNPPILYLENNNQPFMGCHHSDE